MDYQKEAFVIPAARIIRDGLGRTGQGFRRAGQRAAEQGHRAHKAVQKLPGYEFARSHPAATAAAGAGLAGVPVAKGMDTIASYRTQSQLDNKDIIGDPDTDTAAAAGGVPSVPELDRDPRNLSTHLLHAGGIGAATLGTLILLDQLNRDKHDEKVK